MRVNSTHPGSFLARCILVLAGMSLPAFGQGGQIWGQFTTFLGGTTQSQVVTSPASNLEAADDFDLVGTVTTVTITGSTCYPCTSLPISFSAWVRFYDDQLGRPGNLLFQELVPSVVTTNSPEFLMNLATPFASTGRHWVAVQFITQGPHGFGWGFANTGNVVHGPAQTRDRAVGNPWTVLTSTPGGATLVDLAFTLRGSLVLPPTPTGPDPCGAWRIEDLPLPIGASSALVADIAVRSPTEAWAVGSWSGGTGLSATGGPATWRYDGSTWQSVPFPTTAFGNSTPGGLTSVAFTPNGSVVAAGGRLALNMSFFPGGQPMIARWSGSAWVVDSSTAVSYGSGSFVYAIAAVNDNDVWFLGSWIDGFCNGGFAWRWNGSTYTSYPLPCAALPGAVGDFEVIAAEALPDGRVYALQGGEGADPTVIPQLIRFDGMSWSHVPSPTFGYTQFYLRGLDVLPDGTVWMGGGAVSPIALGGSDLRSFAMRFDGTNFYELPVPARAGRPAASNHSVVHFAEGTVQAYDGVGRVQITDFAGQGQVGIINIEALGPCHLVGVGGRRATSLSLSQPIVAWRDQGCSAVPYGPAQPGTLDLSWVPSGPPNAGAIQLSGGTPWTPAVLGVGLGSYSAAVAAGQVLIDLTPGSWFLLPMTLDATGSGSVATSLSVPALAGVSFHLQAALGPGVPLVLSRGLLLRLCN